MIPFQAELPIPAFLEAVPPFTAPTSACQFSPEAALRPTRFFALTMRKGVTQIIPGVDTEIWGYDGLYPGPTIRAEVGEPVVVRQTNALDVETSVHLHGAHAPAASDGFPADLIFPGEFRDYCYPNSPPGGDPNDSMSTAWYHDHAQDITGPNVYMGLAAFYLLFDDLELGLIASGKLPPPDRDIPVVLQDRRFNADGSLFYDTFQHDGFLGDVFVANGKAQPFLRVKRAKYRFRFLNGANARFWLLRLSTGAPFLQVAADSWLLPFAAARQTVLLSMAQRSDLVVDFRNAPDEVFLENILVQDEGRGPKGDLQRPEVVVPGVPLIKFIVEGPMLPDDVTLAPGDPLRPNTPIRPDEIVATRVFEFERRDGAWQVNHLFFDPDRSDAQPRLGSAERWILRNGGGGWWHPIHIHLEAHQVQRFDGQPFLPQQPLQPPIFFKRDTTILGPGDEAEIFMRFRDFPGRYVFHCHNLEHEDDAMMLRFDAV